MKRLETNSTKYTEFVWTLVEQRQIWKLLEPGSFNVQWKAKVLIIVILDCSEVDVRVSNVSAETIRFDECKEMPIMC